MNHKVRVVVLEGAPWFVAADVCRVLEMPLEKGVGQYLSRLMNDEKRPIPLGLIKGKGMNQATLISESGLYKLIMRSNKLEAKKFQPLGAQDWVTREVLPAIRKDGLYVQEEERLQPYILLRLQLKTYAYAPPFINHKNESIQLN